MGERKVLNKYYPPDFDPAKLPKGQRGNKDAQMKVRMMLPMSIRCGTCGTYMYKGTKFNMRMENVEGEDYLGIRIFRFYARCTSCAAEYTMKTDPKNADYTMERGATRNFEPWREKEKTKIEAIKEREAEEAGNAMKALENRTADSKREMDVLNALDELKSLSARHQGVTTEAAIAALQRSMAVEGEPEEEFTAEDQQALESMLLQRASFVRRLEDDEPASSADAAGTAGTAAGPGPSSSGANRANGLPRDPLKPAVLAKAGAAPSVRSRLQVVVKRKAPEPLKTAAKAQLGQAGNSANGRAAEEPAAKRQDAAKGGAQSPSGGDALLGLGSYGSDVSE